MADVGDGGVFERCNDKEVAHDISDSEGRHEQQQHDAGARGRGGAVSAACQWT